MTPEDRDAKLIFGEALRLSVPAERAAYLDRACEGNPSLRQQIESLLLAYAEAGDFMNDTRLLAAPEFLVERAGTMVGRYKLLEKIGEGGFGAVYMAEQVEPVQRKVALKIIKPGMDSRQVIARFEAERQALALMDHPNIAKVLDGGATVAGRPYFVMELVRGVPITDYCDQKRLSMAQRLRLFVKVCHAVQHAHQKGIIHRDLKPTNVMVTLHDGEPVPKIIDFGVAKALGQKLTARTLFTGFAQMLGTPAYMSPEQAELSGLDVDTRSDIYSLGVLLYELLTGVTPFDKESLAQAALDEVRRMFRETEPPKPSTRLQTLGEKLNHVAQSRNTEPMGLRRLVRGDLDWIVMKCLEKDRSRRYETANDLAGDVERHLNVEPIIARPPSSLYHFQKIAHRNRFTLVAAAAVLVALIIGLGVSARMFVKERRAHQATLAAERKARLEAAKSRQVAQFLADMLEGVGPSVALGRDTELLKDIVDKTAERVGKSLQGQPEVEAELRATLGRVYRELGDYSKSEAMHLQALTIMTNLWGSRNAAVADVMHDIAGELAEQGQLRKAEAWSRKALDIRIELLGREHRQVVASLDRLAFILERAGELKKAEPLLQEALTTAKTLSAGKDIETTLSLSQRLAAIAAKQGKLREAEAALRAILATRRELWTVHPSLATTLDELARVLQLEGRLSEAEGMFRDALSLRRQLLGAKHPLVAWSLNRLGVVLHEERNLAEAEGVHREALAMREELLGHKHIWVGDSLDNLGCVLRDEGKFVEAEAMEARAIEISSELQGELLATIPFAHIGACRQQAGKLPEAEDIFRKVLAVWEKKAPWDWWASNAKSYLGQCLVEQQKYDEAEHLLLSAYKGIRVAARVESRQRNQATRASLSRLYNETGRPQKAAEWRQKMAAIDDAGQ